MGFALLFLQFLFNFLLGFLSLRRRVAQDPGGDIVLCNIADDLQILLQVCRLVPEKPGLPAAFQTTTTVQQAMEMVRGNAR